MLIVRSLNIVYLEATFLTGCGFFYWIHWIHWVHALTWHLQDGIYPGACMANLHLTSVTTGLCKQPVVAPL